MSALGCPLCGKSGSAFFTPLASSGVFLRFVVVDLYKCAHLRAPRRLPNVPGRFAKCSPALWKTSPIASVSTVTPFDRACMSNCTCTGAIGRVVELKGIWAAFWCFVDRFGHSLRCLQLHQEPLRRRKLQARVGVRARRSFAKSMSSQQPQLRHQRERHLLPEFRVLRPRLPRLRLLRPRRRPPRNPYPARSTKIRSRPTSRQLGLRLLNTRRRPIFCNRWTERCPALP